MCRVPPNPAGEYVTKAENGFFDHVGSDGRDFAERMRAAGYGGAALGQNLGAAPDGRAMVATWMDSALHCRSIMSDTPRQVGIGFYPRAGSTFGTYWTAVFGAR